MKLIKRLNIEYFVIGHDDKLITPLLEWRQDSSAPCTNYGGGCLRYPIARLQRKDTDLGLNFYVMLHIYNNAGHSIAIQTPDFVIPSTYPPGKAQVIDLDPANVLDANTSLTRLTDVNAHLSQNTVCAAWIGFKHHENVTLEFGVGTTMGSDDIYPYAAINNSEYHCVTSHTFPVDVQLFVSIRASCSGGRTISSSDGVTIYNKHSILNNLKVKVGSACIESKPMFQINGTVTGRNVGLSVGGNYLLILVGKNVSDTVNFFRKLDVYIKQIKSDENQTQITFQPRVEDIFLHCLFNASQDETYFAELHNCEEHLSAMVEGESLTAYWNRHSQDFTYEAAVIQLVCSNSSDDACIKYLTPFVSTSDNAVNFSSMHIQPGEIYYVGVRPCLNSRCLNTVLSTEIHVEPKRMELKIAEANALAMDKNCLNVTIKVDHIKGINISFYQWSLATKIGNSKSISSIGQWSQILVDESKGLTSKVNLILFYPCRCMSNSETITCSNSFTRIT